MTGVGEHRRVIAHFDQAHFNVFTLLGLTGVNFVSLCFDIAHPAEA
jgi:hypothetical protein